MEAKLRHVLFLGLAGLVIVAPCGAADTELTNYKGGIDVVWGVGDGSDKGTAYQEEYWFHDKLINDTKTVYIRSSTTISMAHNARNMGAVTVTSGGDPTRTRTTIGANGMDGVAGGVTYSGVAYNNGTSTFTYNNHGRSNGDALLFVSGTFGTGITALTRYYVTSATTNTFQLKFKISDVGVTSPTTSGSNGVFIYNDEGRIRYEIDRLWNKQRNWAKYETRKPEYTAPFALDDIEYEAGVSVVGTTGGSIADQTSPSFYWRGLVDSAGDEWHVLMVADDDSTMRGTDDALASDGKYMLLCVNPKTPAMTVRATGDGQFYTTPAWTYWVPKIHDQTTYFNAGTGTVTFELRNIYGANISYDINGGAAVDVGASTVTLNAANFSTGTNTLRYWYTATPSVKRTRTIVKNPSFPSAGETHGTRRWGSTYWTAFQSRTGRAPYSTEIAAMQTTGRTNFSTWESQRRTGLRFGGTNWQYGNGGGGSESFLAKHLGFTATQAGAAQSYALFAKEKLLECQLNQHPVGYEISAWASDPIPCGDIVYRGYWDADPTQAAAVAYDILIGGFKSTDHTGGITPIEDYFIRDRLASWVHLSLVQMGGFCVPNDAGMWPTARNVAAMVVAAIMPNYSTPYYGTCGLDGTTTVYEWAPYQTYNYTWKDLFIERDNSLHAYPTGPKIHFGMEGLSSTDALTRAVGTFVKSMTGATADAATDTVTWTNHGMQNDEPVAFTSGSGFGGLSPTGTYYVKNRTTNTFQLSSTQNGSVIDITSSGSGGVFTYTVDASWSDRTAYTSLSQMGQWVCAYSNILNLYAPGVSRTAIDKYISDASGNEMYGTKISSGEVYGPSRRPYINFLNDRHSVAATNATAYVQSLASSNGDSDDDQIKFNYNALVEYDDTYFGEEGPLPPESVPSAPTGLSLTAVRNTGWTASWTDNATDETTYEIQWRIGAGAWTADYPPANATSYSLGELPAGTTYEVQVRAINAAGSSAWVAASPTTVTTGAPAPVYRGRSGGVAGGF